MTRKKTRKQTPERGELILRFDLERSSDTYLNYPRNTTLQEGDCDECQLKNTICVEFVAENNAEERFSTFVCKYCLRKYANAAEAVESAIFRPTKTGVIP